MIVRIWRGWTTSENAEAYQHLLDTTIVPGILAREIPGLGAIDILRRRDSESTDVEFVTIMNFADWTAVEAFAGPGATSSVVPAAAQALLSRWDQHSKHYETIARHS